MKRTPLQSARRHRMWAFAYVTTMNCSQVETLMRTTSMQMSLPETVSDNLWRNSLVMQTDCCSSCPGGWSQTILEVKMLDVEVLGWWGRLDVLPNSLKRLLEMAYVRETNIQFMGNSSGGHSCYQHANFALPQNWNGIVLCDKTSHFRVAFYFDPV